MMWWGKKQAGSDISIHENELLLNTGVPDAVKLPLELGGGEVRVIESFINVCPQCDNRVRHLKLERGLYVSECSVHKFLWYKKKES